MATDDAPQTVEPPRATASAGAATPAVTATATPVAVQRRRWPHSDNAAAAFDSRRSTAGAGPPALLSATATARSLWRSQPLSYSKRSGDARHAAASRACVVGAFGVDERRRE